MNAPAGGSLSYDTYLDHIEREVTDIADLLADGAVDPGTPVPACPGWGAVDLRNHCAEVLVFWHRQVLTADPGATEPTFGPEDEARLGLPLGELAAGLVAELRAAGEDRGCWNWSGEGLTTRWVARRMAQEFGVHRADAQATVGRSVVIDLDLAADGIDELVDVFLNAVRPVTPQGVLALVSSYGRTWLLALSVDDGVVRTDEPAGLTVIGEPDQLLLYLWGREASVTEDGDESVMATWRELAEFD
jgi:uncharacterized protein (TIGR03083 family)